VITLPQGFLESGKLVYFDIGGVIRRFALDANGMSRIGDDSVKFRFGNSLFTQVGAIRPDHPQSRRRGASGRRRTGRLCRKSPTHRPRDPDAEQPTSTKSCSRKIYTSNGSTAKPKTPN